MVRGDLLKEYRTSGADRPEVTEVILRRGLELPGEPAAAEVATFEWSGEGDEGAIRPSRYPWTGVG